MTKPFFFNGSERIELDSEKCQVNFQREELTNYHKRDYDFITYRPINVTTSADAEFLFRELKDIYQHGKQAGVAEAGANIKEAVKRALNGETR